MRKVALVFLLAVFVPSLVLAWLAVRSLRDQQFLLERQQSLLYQGVADALSRDTQELLADYQRSFTTTTRTLLRSHSPQELAKNFDEVLRKEWPVAQVGFVVSVAGNLLCPSPKDSPEARLFCVDNTRFLANRESAEVYLNPKAAGQNVPAPAPASETGKLGQNWLDAAEYSTSRLKAKDSESLKGSLYNKSQARAVVPQQALQNFEPVPGKAEAALKQVADNTGNLSKVAPSETEFRQLIGDANEGTLARFVDDKLNVLFWYRAVRDSQLIFGAQLALPRLNTGLQERLGQFEPALRNQICMAILDDKARPVAQSQPGFKANWRHPFVATEIGEILPHWEAAVYLVNPKALAQSANTIKLTLGLLIAVLVVAIGVGSWLIVMDLNRQLSLARQKTDFVSNVSHELKTPLTSIRMFSELLAEGRVVDVERQRSYLGIITAETARLTRLINNVLDFARIERGEKKYQFQKCDLTQVVRETVQSYKPQLEANGFQFSSDLPDGPVWVNGDRDSLAQVIVNLLSNAEKYSDKHKDILLALREQSTPLPYAELKVSDRGMGVPKGCEEKIFEQFYRAHDSLNSGIQGSGLGLTLARQVARAHGGEMAYEAREGGGSCFCLRLPVLKMSNNE
jgi:signal transduction histidine kinase